jgi:hypothetical protein
MIKGDSTDYNLLAKWVDQLSPKDFYLTVEIGVREGYGSHVIMEILKDKNNFHIGIDPYGDITYEHLDPRPGTAYGWKDPDGNILYNEDGSYKTPTYPNSMKQTFLTAFKKHENFILYQLEDIEYFNAFGQGVPIYYKGQKKIINNYDFVHFDGPHTTAAVLHEALFFANRSNPGTRFVFDDVGTYNMDLIQQALTHYDFYLIEQGKNKMCLEKSYGLQKS